MLEVRPISREAAKAFINANHPLNAAALPPSAGVVA